jgi:hypothetical protein
MASIVPWLTRSREPAGTIPRTVVGRERAAAAFLLVRRERAVEIPVDKPRSIRITRTKNGARAHGHD